MDKIILRCCDIDALAKLGGERYESKRKAGKKLQPWHSKENDVQAIGAEYAAGVILGLKIDEDIYTHGDGGCDFKMWTVNGERTIEAKWIGQFTDKETGEKKPRTWGHLIVDPKQPHRFADVYIAMSGWMELGFDCCGWMKHRDLIQYPRQDFGFGLHFAAPTRDLAPIETLLELRV